MKRRRVLVLLVITILLLNSTLALASSKKDKEKKDKDPKDKNRAEPKTKKEKPEKPEKETEPKEAKNKHQSEEAQRETKKDETPRPIGLHGPGKGSIKSAQKWSGDVWAHYDYNDDFDQWEVGIEGFTGDGGTAWYSFCLVEGEVFENSKLSASGAFPDEPFNGLEFEYTANLNSMRWKIKGDGFHFTGTIVDIFFEEPTDDALPSMKPELKAKGTIDAYVDAYSARVVEGSWRVTLRNGQVEYTAKYIEENLDEGVENSPVGSTDIFWHAFTVEAMSFDGEELLFSGTLHVEKLWSKLDGSKEKVGWDTYPVTITIDSGSFFLDSPPAGEGPGVYDQDWDRVGTTTQFK